MYLYIQKEDEKKLKIRKLRDQFSVNRPNICFVGTFGLFVKTQQKTQQKSQRTRRTGETFSLLYFGISHYFYSGRKLCDL